MSKTMKVAVPSTRGVVDRWVRQYPLGHATGRWDQVSRRLMEVGENTAPDEIATIIGNKSWTHPMCSACGEYVECAVELNTSDDARVCANCLREALKVLEGGV